MTLSNVVCRLGAGELAREPRHLGVIAYFDGYSRGSNPKAKRSEYPRRLTRDEGASWREGFAEGRTERVCHSWHGFVPCLGDHPLTIGPGLITPLRPKDAAR